jgi:hypothetical protein
MQINPARAPKGFFTLQYVRIPLFPTLTNMKIRLHPLELAAWDAVVLSVQSLYGQKNIQISIIPDSQALR